MFNRLGGIVVLQDTMAIAPQEAQGEHGKRRNPNSADVVKPSSCSLLRPLTVGEAIPKSSKTMVMKSIVAAACRQAVGPNRHGSQVSCRALSLEIHYVESISYEMGAIGCYAANEGGDAGRLRVGF